MASLLRLMSSWHPTLLESRDGDSLVTSISGFVVDFPYDRLPENKWLALTLRPGSVLLLVAFYLISEPLLKVFIWYFGLTGKSSAFRSAVALHNLMLAVFSFVVAIKAWPVVISHFTESGWEATYCDRDGTLWEAGLGTWSIIFYISKYWEFIDTWIIVIKGKKPSFLQVYHHAGIVLTMWGGVVTQAPWLSVVVLLNSVIHTVMYIYFFIKTIAPHFEIKAARYLTLAQIAQFFTGIFGSLYMQVMGDRCVTLASRLVLAMLQMYGVGLIVLFQAFSSKKYKKA